MEAFPIYSRSEFAADRVVHVVGLLGMLSASAAYNMARPSWAKAELRRVDRCMIFVMIAGTYTPFALGIMPHQIGVPLCITVWSLAGLGIILQYGAPRIARPVSLPLYLAMGWLILNVLPALMTAVGTAQLLLLISGGIVSRPHHERVMAACVSFGQIQVHPLEPRSRPSTWWKLRCS